MSTLKIALEQLEPALMAEGSRGRRVVRLQKVLRLAGCYTSFVDGIYGPKTRNAVETVQHYLGQEPTGIFNPEVWHGLALESRYPDDIVSACRRHQRRRAAAERTNKRNLSCLV